MKVSKIKKIVGDAPYMSIEQAERMTSLIRTHKTKDVLELGFFHGVSSCYIAGAVKKLRGHLTTIDFEGARNRKPNIHTLLDACKLSDHVTIHFEPQSFTWRLMRMLEDGQGPRFDMVYLDGGHSWDVTGFAFFLVDRLLRPGGWLIFDDIDWTYDSSPSLRNNPKIQRMPEDYRATPQVRKVFELLVEPHPDYTECQVEQGWGLARKRR